MASEVTWKKVQVGKWTAAQTANFLKESQLGGAAGGTAGEGESTGTAGGGSGIPDDLEGMGGDVLLDLQPSDYEDIGMDKESAKQLAGVIEALRKPLAKWTTQDLQVYVMTRRKLKAEMKAKIVKGLQDNGFTGDLVADAELTAKDLADALDVPKLFAKVLCADFKLFVERDAAGAGGMYPKLKQKEMASVARAQPSAPPSAPSESAVHASGADTAARLAREEQERKMKQMEQKRKREEALRKREETMQALGLVAKTGYGTKVNPDDAPSGTFYLHVRSPDGKLHKLNNTVSGTTTVRTLKDMYTREYGGDSGNLTMYSKSKPLVPDTATLNDLKINKDSLIMIAFKVKGGMAKATTSYGGELRHVFDPKKYPEMKTTTRPDDIMFYDEEDDPRVIMECGHAFCADTVYQLIKVVFRDKSFKDVTVTCPMLECKKPWSFDYCRKAANLSDAEFFKYQMIIEKREMMGGGSFRECPVCGNLCERPKRLDSFRVTCPCKKQDFCWSCNGPWKGTGLQLCGNSRCVTTETNDTLQKCPLKNPSYLPKEVMMPSIRACPRCLALVEHKEACKHMSCKTCKAEFCFMCLRVREGEWKCGTHTTVCTIAPRQRLT